MIGYIKFLAPDDVILDILLFHMLNLIVFIIIVNKIDSRNNRINLLLDYIFYLKRGLLYILLKKGFIVYFTHKGGVRGVYPPPRCVLNKHPWLVIPKLSAITTGF